MANRPTLHSNSKALLQTLLQEPKLDQLVQQLGAADWKVLVRHVGLEDSSELLSLSTPEQLIELVDETLWAGETSDEFDLERFATLLEVLHESGNQRLAEKVAELPDDFLIMALGQLVSVWPSDFLQQLAEADDSGVLDKRLESQMSEDLGDFTLLSANGLGWDPVLALLTTWSDSHPNLYARILDRLASANARSIGEPDELVNVLDEMAEFAEEAQAEREERRARSGYVSKSDARAFLRLPPVTGDARGDAISKAYFRRLRPEPMGNSGPDASRLMALLNQHSEREFKPTRPQLPSGAGALKSALDELAERAPKSHAQALEELAFLTNVLVAASTEATPNHAEAIRAVSNAVESGALSVVLSEGAQNPHELSLALENLGPIALFRNRPR